MLHAVDRYHRLLLHDYGQASEGDRKRELPIQREMPDKIAAVRTVIEKHTDATNNYNSLSDRLQLLEENFQGVAARPKPIATSAVSPPPP